MRRVVRAGAPLSETCGLSLSLCDSPTAGTFINSNTFSSVPIAEGLFTVQIDYGNTAFAGEERYLETAVKCAADASYVTLTPRTRLTAAPYAQYALRNWGLAGNAATGGTGFLGTSDNVALSIGVNGAPALPIASWSYRTQDPSIRHMGPMAQDFREAFGLGESERHIGTVDADGVALAAIQGLRQLLREREAVIEDLQARLERLERFVVAPAR